MVPFKEWSLVLLKRGMSRKEKNTFCSDASRCHLETICPLSSLPLPSHSPPQLQAGPFQNPRVQPWATGLGVGLTHERVPSLWLPGGWERSWGSLASPRFGSDPFHCLPLWRRGPACSWTRSWGQRLCLPGSEVHRLLNKNHHWPWTPALLLEAPPKWHETRESTL